MIKMMVESRFNAAANGQRSGKASVGEFYDVDLHRRGSESDSFILPKQKKVLNPSKKYMKPTSTRPKEETHFNDPPYGDRRFIQSLIIPRIRKPYFPPSKKIEIYGDFSAFY